MAEATIPGTYPVDVEATFPESSSRGWALLFILFGLKSFALIVHMVVLFIYGIGALFVFLVSQLVVLFSGHYPEGMHAFLSGILRWSNEMSGWLVGLTDKFPPFAPSHDPYPVKTTITRPEHSSRGWAAMTIFLIKFLALFPHIVVLYVLGLVEGLLALVANLVILFTGRFPDGLFDFIVAVLRWQTRVGAFAFGLVDEYPPFSLT
jgi:hypothetical protein